MVGISVEEHEERSVGVGFSWILISIKVSIAKLNSALQTAAALRPFLEHNSQSPIQQPLNQNEEGFS